MSALNCYLFTKLLMAMLFPTYEIDLNLIVKRNAHIFSKTVALSKPNKDFCKRCLNYSAAVLRDSLNYHVRQRLHKLYNL